MTIGFSGSPVQMVLVQTDNQNPDNSPNFPYSAVAYAAGAPKFFFVLYDELLTIDANGICSLIR
jgi:hypothetical protein